MSAKGLSSRAIIGAFYARLQQNIGAEWIPQVCTDPFPSDQESETYKWLGMSPVMREWIGGRQAKGFRENGFTIRNKPFEATLEVLLDELRRDKTKQIMVRVNEMADKANAHWAKLASAQIVNGASSLCYDGQYFFDTDHVEGDSGVQSNSISYDVATPTAPTAAEMESIILKGTQQLLSFKDDTGEPMNEEMKEILVMVPVPFMAAAGAALKNPVIVDVTGARTNTLVNLGGFNYRLAVNPRLSWTDKLALFRTDVETKAIVRQEEQPLEVAAIAEGSELEFNEKKHHYGVSAIRNAGFGYWQRGTLITLT